MTPLEQLENKIRQSIPELREEYEIFQEGAIDFDMVTPIMLNHVMLYFGKFNMVVGLYQDGDVIYDMQHILSWNLKSAYLKHQSQELINFLNDLN